MGASIESPAAASFAIRERPGASMASLSESHAAASVAIREWPGTTMVASIEAHAAIRETAGASSAREITGAPGVGARGRCG
jgi:hypothetical protein